MNTGTNQGTNGKQTWLWDWPLNDDGHVRCSADDDLWSVTLDFKYLKASDIQVHTFDKLHQNNYNCSVGLCPITSHDAMFCRLEILLMPEQNIICIEIIRQVYRSDHESKRMMKRMKKMYKLPEFIDVLTLKAIVAEDGCVILKASKRNEQKTVSGKSKAEHKNQRT